MLVSLTHPSLNAFKLDSGTVSIGRDPAADIFIDSPGVSRLHALIQIAGNEVELVDARSSNGTFLNGNKVDRAVLRYGDVVRVGTEELKVVPRPVPLSHDLVPAQNLNGVAAAAVFDATLKLLAEERRQLAVLFTLATRCLESANSEDPIDLMFRYLDRLVSFDAAFVSAPSEIGPQFRHHPAGLRLKDEDCRQVLAAHTTSTAKCYDGPDDALSLSTYRARARALVPLANGGYLGLLAGIPHAYSPQLDFLIQLGRILSAAIKAREARG